MALPSRTGEDLEQAARLGAVAQIMSTLKFQKVHVFLGFLPPSRSFFVMNKEAGVDSCTFLFCLLGHSDRNRLGEGTKA